MRARMFRFGFAEVIGGVVISGAAAASVSATHIFNKREGQNPQQAGVMQDEAKMKNNGVGPEGGISRDYYKFKL